MQTAKFRLGEGEFMHNVARPSSGLSRLIRTVATVIAAAGMVAVTPIAGSATAFVSKLSFSPSPIGTVGTVPAGSNVSIVLTAKDSHSNVVPGGTVFLTFQQAASGGTAFVGTVGLARKPQMFIADSNGHVGITYSTPPSYPTAGCDVVHAQNEATRATSTAIANDSFCFSPITALAFAPRPIAPAGSLGTSSHVTVTLTVFGPNGTRLSNGTVWLSFHKNATNGGSARVNGVAVGGAFVAETTNSNGQVFIDYSTGTTLPDSGSDRLVASNAQALGTILSRNSYVYGTA
jgi:hypothetical protein